MRALFALTVLVVGATTQLSCNVNDYCLNCGTDDGGIGGNGDASDGGGSAIDDANDGGGCIPTGPEECDGKDNDCNGLTDDGVLPGVGDPCSNQQGICAGGVVQCTNGVLKCNKSAMPETCNHLDDNCNGTIDDGDPGGGAKCGTDEGECVAGQYHCNATTGTLECFGFIDHTADPELCDAKDNDCDGKFDEGLSNLGPCGPTSDDGECTFGTLACQGGQPVCQNAVFPKFETCNNLDDDCDTKTDEVFNKQTDPNNCGMCGMVCPAQPNANTACATGTCGFVCKPGYHDLVSGGGVNAGCEYGPCFASGAEVCDGVDNDCDNKIDESLTPPSICRSGGECGTTAPVATCGGAAGWSCTYPGVVEFPETKCDGKNNDCDANTDEGQPNLGQACDDGRQGECRGTGTYICDTANVSGPAVCNVTSPGQTTPAAQETCDNKDNDCDGKSDEGSETGNLLGQEWVDLGNGKQMMKYEASRFDSTSTQQGAAAAITIGPLAASPTGATQAGAVATFRTLGNHTLAVNDKVRVSGVGVTGYNGVWTVASVPTTTTFTATLTTTGLAASGGGSVARYRGACSKSGSIPWTNVSYVEALAACQSMGANLCTETRWHQACSAVAAAGTGVITIDGTNGTSIETEDFSSITTLGGKAWVEDYTTDDTTSAANEQHSGIANMRAMPNTGTAVSLANALANSPRLDYLVNIATAGADYRIYVRMFSPTNGDNTLHVGIAATVAAPTATLTTSGNGDWRWMSTGALNLTTGQKTLSLFMSEDGAKIDRIFIVRGTTILPPTTLNALGGTWSYASNPTTYVGATCNGADQSATDDNIRATGSSTSCYADLTGGKQVFDMSGNVKEWTLARLPGQNPIRGGASNDTPVGISCALNFQLGSDTFFFPNVGFRCCR